MLFRSICFMESNLKINKVELRNLRMEDYDQLAGSFKRIYADHDVFWTHAQIKKLITIFPEGQVVIVVDDKIVGCALSIIVDYNMVKGDHTYDDHPGFAAVPEYPLAPARCTKETAAIAVVHRLLILAANPPHLALRQKLFRWQLNVNYSAVRQWLSPMPLT